MAPPDDHNPDFVPRDRLAQKVHDLSADKFLAVYRLYEQLGRQVTVADEMQVLRLRLRRLRPRRSPSFTRLLCLPFEDFIGDGADAGPYLTPRRHCRTLGRLTSALMDRAEAASLRKRIAELGPEDVAPALQIGSELWRRAASGLRGADIKRNTKRRKAGLRETLPLMIDCLTVGPQMAMLTEGLPRERFRDLDGRARNLIAKVLQSVPEQRRDLMRYPLVLLSQRLETATEIIALLEDSRIDLPTPLRKEAIDAMTRHLETDLQAEVGHVEALAGNDAFQDVDQLLDRLMPSVHKAEANLKAGIGQVPARIVLDAASDLVRERIVMRTEAEFGDRMEALVRKCLSAPLQATGDRDVLYDDFEKLDDLTELEENLQTLTRLSEEADMLGLRLELSRATDSALKEIEQASATLLASIQDRTSRDMQRQRQQDLYGILRLIEVLGGPERADDIRRECDLLVKKAA